MNIDVFPGRVLVEREEIPNKGPIINIKKERRRNKGKVVKSGDKRYKVGDDVFFAARRGTIFNELAIIDTEDIILKNMKLLVGKRVAVEPIEAEKKTEGGIIVPDSIKIQPQTGYIRVLGEDVDKNKYHEGDKILFSQNTGIKVDDGKKSLLILDERDIYAIL